MVLLLLAVPSGSAAQVNAETLAEGITKPGWGGAGKSTLAFSSGNVSLLEVRGELKWLRYGGEIFAQAQYDEFRLLSRRLLIGAGVRIVFANLERFRLWFDAGRVRASGHRSRQPAAAQ